MLHEADADRGSERPTPAERKSDRKCAGATMEMPSRKRPYELETAASTGESPSCDAAPTAARALPTERWVQDLLTATYFCACPLHREAKKNECTFFCMDCGGGATGLCPSCLGPHLGHRVLQVRRYVYCDVIRASDLSHEVDISGVQNYTINQAKVVFLRQKSQSRSGKPGGVDCCCGCGRTVKEGCAFCSLACKIEVSRTHGAPLRPAGAGEAAAAAAAATAATDSDDGGSSAGQTALPRQLQQQLLFPQHAAQLAAAQAQIAAIAAAQPQAQQAQQGPPPHAGASPRCPKGQKAHPTLLSRALQAQTGGGPHVPSTPAARDGSVARSAPRRKAGAAAASSSSGEDGGAGGHATAAAVAVAAGAVFAACFGGAGVVDAASLRLLQCALALAPAAAPPPASLRVALHDRKQKRPRPSPAM